MLKIEELAKKIANEQQCELYDVEVVGSGQGRILRIFIDKTEGVGIEDCSQVSRGLNEILDTEDIVPGGMYNLEVSSPGLERHLKTTDHFKKAIGKKIWLQLSQNLGSLGVEDKALLLAKKVEAQLIDFIEPTLKLEIKSHVITVPFSNVEKAHVVFEMETQTKTNHLKQR